MMLIKTTTTMPSWLFSTCQKPLIINTQYCSEPVWRHLHLLYRGFPLIGQTFVHSSTVNAVTSSDPDWTSWLTRKRLKKEIKKKSFISEDINGFIIYHWLCEKCTVVQHWSKERWKKQVKMLLSVREWRVEKGKSAAESLKLSDLH